MARTNVRRVKGKHLRRATLQISNQQTTSLLRRSPQTSRLKQPTQTICSYKAKPITPPQSAGLQGMYQCIVDYNREPFSIIWSGSPEYPDLARFPVLDKNVDVSLVRQSSEIAAIWRHSTVLDYGSHASIRITKDGRFPILKLAHSDELSIKLIQHEFDVLADLTKLGLPVVEFDQQPVMDNGVICGYRMKKLLKLEPSGFHSQSNKVKQALDQFHSAGFSHGDFSPSNVMKDKSGHIILIDFSFAGRLGRSVPSFFPSWVYTDGIYTISSDLERFGRYTVLI